MGIRSALHLALLAVLTLAACDGAAEPQAQAQPTDDADWQTQLEAVAAGEAHAIRIDHADTTDDHLASLDNLPNLRQLNLGRARFTEAGLRHLVAAAPNLELLRIDGADLDDNALAHLQSLTRLRHLMLYNVPVGDEGLRRLHELETLESFYFSGTHITDAGVRQLTQALPGLHVHW